MSRRPFTTLNANTQPGNRVQRTRQCSVKYCHNRFTPRNMAHKACSPECAQILATKAREKEERRSHRLRLDHIKSAKELKHEAQAAFNAWIRWRDRFELCICCNEPFEPMKPGGSIDAGHYLSVGSAPHLRFDERNVHAQRKNCNRPGGTTRAKFRVGMIAREGLEVVEALEADQTPRNYRAEDYRAIRDLYRNRLKDDKAKHRLSMTPCDLIAGVAIHEAIRKAA